MNGRDMMPACARIAAADPAMADRMWNTTTDDDGRDLVDERMRGKGRVLCAACPSRIDLDQAAGVKDLCDRRGVPAAILLCRTEANTTALRDALAWIDAADIACFETLIPKRQDILNAKSTRPRGSRLHEYRDLSGELKQTMRQLKGEDL